jgi:bifunctional UDP-N-acetylglucosamine pyrophosphorylase / glucosamine-1-phosphate N-acetyltransferase
MKKRNIIYSQKQLINYFQDSSLRMGKNTIISFKDNLKLGSNILFQGKIILGKNNKIDSNCVLKNINFGNNNHIRMSSLINDSQISDNILIGPFAFIRDKTKIEKKCIIGAYVEITRSTIHHEVYASHRAFIGDANIGSKSIIGAGVVFCNYSFKDMRKKKTIIGKNCKIGSNSTIIAPVKIKNNSIIPALKKFNGLK